MSLKTLYKFDGKEYIHYTSENGRPEKSQFASFEWRRSPAGTTRTLKFDNGEEVHLVVVYTERWRASRWIPKVFHMWQVYHYNDSPEYIAKEERLDYLLQNSKPKPQS